jgi:hypothetical protein
MAFVPASLEIRIACDTLNKLIAQGGEQARVARRVLDDGALFLAFVRGQRSRAAAEDEHPRRGG